MKETVAKVRLEHSSSCGDLPVKKQWIYWKSYVQKRAQLHSFEIEFYQQCERKKQSFSKKTKNCCKKIDAKMRRKTKQKMIAMSPTQNTQSYKAWIECHSDQCKPVIIAILILFSWKRERIYLPFHFSYLMRSLLYTGH